MQKEKPTSTLLNKLYKESLIPALVFTVICSSIFYFANSRHFYFVQSEEMIHEPHYKIIPPSDHLINSGENYSIHVMVKTPLQGLKASTIPILFLVIHLSIKGYIKKEVANRCMERTGKTPGD
ncbi:hypothetical protein [Pontiella agarivorans]|uniref:Uncharacterized protein n=1 Tax=Pontiella agarivorans TaxID=3038953 RepID=A0ABU5N282_9BACT|nr:hypothetical protein [Pontiella agarivorans]MDZ8120550.1 hypothetical protein [Pontiella agarivorans]